MNEIQLTAAYALATSATVRNAHAFISETRKNEPWEFGSNMSGWIQSHVTSAPEQGESAKVIQGCIQSMGNELKVCFTDNLTNTLL